MIFQNKKTWKTLISEIIKMISKAYRMKLKLHITKFMVLVEKFFLKQEMVLPNLHV